MSTVAMPAPPAKRKVALPAKPAEGRDAVTANDRFHASFGSLVWASLILATGIHAAVFNFWPEVRAKDVSYSAQELAAIELPPEIRIPEAPQAIARPATPVMAMAKIAEDITIAPTTFEANPVSELPPPPEPDRAQIQTDLAAAPVFTPYTVRPEIRNREEVREALEREYPPLLRDAGIGGMVQVWFFIDEAGKVQRTLVQVTSGYKALDDAAMKVADIIEFTPALNLDKRVPVWIYLPITFVIR
jgi:TonB family protein